jgi:hypothetical protein
MDSQKMDVPPEFKDELDFDKHKDGRRYSVALCDLSLLMDTESLSKIINQQPSIWDWKHKQGGGIHLEVCRCKDLNKTLATFNALSKACTNPKRHFTRADNKRRTPLRILVQTHQQTIRRPNELLKQCFEKLLDMMGGECANNIVDYEVGRLYPKEIEPGSIYKKAMEHQFWRGGWLDVLIDEKLMERPANALLMRDIGGVKTWYRGYGMVFRIN